MIKTALICFFLFVAIAASSQNSEFSSPEYEKMRLQIFDNTSPYFYPKLFERYLLGDTSLTLNDFRFLYYGYTFNPRYIPFQQSKYQAKMIAFMKKGTLTSKELDEFIKLSELNLKDFPFDIATLNILAYSYKHKGDNRMYFIADFKKSMIIKAIQSSGDGLTETSAFHIIDRSHQFDFVNELGMKVVSTNDLSGLLCEYLIFQPNANNVRGYYFNQSRIFNVKAEPK